MRRSFCFLILDNVHKRDAQPAGVEVHRNAVSDGKFVEIFFRDSQLIVCSVNINCDIIRIFGFIYVCNLAHVFFGRLSAVQQIVYLTNTAKRKNQAVNTAAILTLLAFVRSRIRKMIDRMMPKMAEKTISLVYDK